MHLPYVKSSGSHEGVKDDSITVLSSKGDSHCHHDHCGSVVFQGHIEDILAISSESNVWTREADQG